MSNSSGPVGLLSMEGFLCFAISKPFLWAQKRPRCSPERNRLAVQKQWPARGKRVFGKLMLCSQKETVREAGEKNYLSRAES